VNHTPFQRTALDDCAPPSAFVHARADRTDHPEAPRRHGAPYAVTIRAAGGTSRAV
jgi:hypothetical protein